jgi:hypothetical protein
VSNVQKTIDSDATLTALTQALEEITRKDGKTPSAFDWDDEPTVEGTSSTDDEPAKPASRPLPEQVAASDEEGFAYGKALAWSLIALLGAVGVGAYVFAWPSQIGHAVPSAPSPAQAASATEPRVMSAPDRVAGQTPPAVAPEVRIPDPKLTQAQLAPQRAEKPELPEMTPVLQSLERRMTRLEQQIEQITATQGKLISAQERLLSSAGELGGQFRGAEQNAARDRAVMAEQLRLSQEQLAKINEQLKANQEQIERSKTAPQPQRAVRPAPAQPQTAVTPAAPKPAPTVTSAAPKPAPKPSPVQARVAAPPPAGSAPPQPAR